ncbi:MAG: peptidoglycan editing factor PgeF [Peptococcaceae bacterium]|nr:peptidoglycan editing factor PgeF [Peptococcaceae bacterium]
MERLDSVQLDFPDPGKGWSWQYGQADQPLQATQADQVRISYLSLAWEEYGVTTAFSARGGGVSAKPYDTLNLGLHVGDLAQDVLENRRRFGQLMSISAQECVVSEQVHGVRIAQVGEAHGEAGMLDKASAVAGCDALATQERVGLMAFFADCVPLFFCDPKTHWVALAHAGWRGSAAGMARVMVEFLIGKGCQVPDIRAGIGPCVGSCCYEVDEAVVEAFREGIPGFSHYAHSRPDGKYALDLQEANRLELVRAGLEESHIASASLCTACHGSEFFSYRKNSRTGRMAGFIRRRGGS